MPTSVPRRSANSCKSSSTTWQITGQQEYATPHHRPTTPPQPRRGTQTSTSSSPSTTAATRAHHGGRHHRRSTPLQTGSNDSRIDRRPCVADSATLPQPPPEGATVRNSRGAVPPRDVSTHIGHPRRTSPHGRPAAARLILEILPDLTLRHRSSPRQGATSARNPTYSRDDIARKDHRHRHPSPPSPFHTRPSGRAPLRARAATAVDATSSNAEARDAAADLPALHHLQG